MTNATPPNQAGPLTRKPAHYRLSKATWAIILAEYREGATVPELVLKWRVSEHSLRKQITRSESTKRDWGDAQAIAQAQERAAAAEAARADSPEARAGRLFVGVTLEDAQIADPAILTRVATLASGRAMFDRLWPEAKALAGLAEAYSRLEARPTNAPPTAERMDLRLLFRIMTLTEPSIEERFNIDPDRLDEDPDLAVKERFWRWWPKVRDALRDAAPR